MSNTSNTRIPSMTHLLDNTHKRRAIRNLYKMISEGGGGGDYPPSGGVPKSDLSSSVQASLDLADSAVQPAAIANLESKMAVVAASGTALTASVDNYYLFSSEVGTLAITLTTPSDTTHITKVVFMLTTGSSPAVTFAGASGINVIAQDGFSIEASTTYEINAIYNGVAWVVAAMKLSSTPINS